MTTPRVGVVFRPQLSPEQLPDAVRRAEQAGVDDLWLWEDCFLEGGLTAATAALAWTERLHVGLGLMPVPFRNPALAAMEIATLARLFPGRFVPSAGHGVLTWMEQVGARAASPMTLLREWVSAVRALLRGETVSVSGSYVRLDEVALDWPPAAPPPLLIGARGPRTVALAGEVADGVLLDGGLRTEGVREAVAQAGGSRDGFHVVTYLLAGPDPAPLVAELERFGLAGHDEFAAGTPDEVAAAVRARADAGATTVALYPPSDDADIDALIELAAAVKAALPG